MVNKNFHIIQNIPSTIKTKSQREEKKLLYKTCIIQETMKPYEPNNQPTNQPTHKRTYVFQNLRLRKSQGYKIQNRKTERKKNKTFSK